MKRGNISRQLVDTTNRSTSTLIVANRLPVEYQADGEWRPSPGGLVKAMEPALSHMDVVWVGWSGAASCSRSGGATSSHPVGSNNLVFIEVPMTRAEVISYYEGFCNGALWPLYHDAVVAPVFRDAHFQAYCAVNRRFADSVAEHAPPGSHVWVHDYHLQLVPGFLREMRPDLRIGFFLHIPFPSSTHFDTLPWKETILKGLLGADLIGFQTPQGADRFMDEVCRHLPASRRDQLVELKEPTGNRRRVAVKAFPISPPAARFAELSTSPATRDAAARIRSDFRNPEVVLLGVDRLDYTKGITQRIRAVADLLESEAFRDREIQFIQVAMPSRTGLDAYKRLRNSVEDTLRVANAGLVARGLRPIHYVYDELATEQIVALYDAADVMLVTSLADGMNLVCKEYVACRHRGDGRLVLSNKTGAAVQLVDAWMVEPADIDDVKRGISEAIDSSAEEAARRMAGLRRVVFNHDEAHWADGFLDDLSTLR